MCASPTSNPPRLHWGYRLLVRILPARVKRFICLASLSALAKDQGVEDKELAYRLNQLFGLTSTGDAALLIAVEKSCRFWPDVHALQDDIELLKTCESEDAAQRSAQRVASAVPAWLRYSREQDLQRDVQRLFMHTNTLFAPA